MPITILLVDDSEIIRFLYGKALERDPELSVVATAANGEEAIQMAREHQPDVILLDIEMPRMDGLTALPHLRTASPDSAIFILSSFTQHYAHRTVDALTMGAIECLAKPGAEGVAAIQKFHEELRNKIKSVVGAVRKQDRPQPSLIPQPPRNTVPTKAKKVKLYPKPAMQSAALAEPAPSKEIPTAYALRPRTQNTIEAIVIASSTGGPESLMSILTELKEKPAHIPIFITQHMPPLFTAVLADHLSRHSGRTCKEAVDGERVLPGVVYVAPGDRHLFIRKHNHRIELHLSSDAPINSCRPSADPMFASASHVYGSHLLGIILTGIGSDGTQGARVVVDQGGAVIAQDKTSSIVYGMPRAVAEAGLCESILPLTKIASEIIRRCQR